MTATLSPIPRSAPWRGLVSVVDYAVAKHSRAVAVLLALCFLSFVPGFFQTPPMERAEARFAQSSKQMIETGDYVDIRLLDEVRYQKPIGIYWLQVAAVKTAQALGVSDALRKIWLYRIPSLIGAIGAVLLTYWTALALVSRRAALLAAVMLAAAGLLGVEARLAKTDAMLLLTCMAAMGVVARIYLGKDREGSENYRRWILPGIFWTAIAGGILLKGPLIALFVGLPLIVLSFIDRSGRWILKLRPLPGVFWVLLLTLPWFVAILSRAGMNFLSDSMGKDFFGKVAGAQESHGAPPGLFLLMFFPLFWPASILSGLVAPSVWRERAQPATKFLLAWLLPAWIMFEIVPTKLVHYVLPLYPAIAILIAGRIDPLALSRGKWLERGAVWWFIVPVIMSGLAVWALLKVGGTLGVLAWPLLAASLVFGFRAWWLYEADGAEASFLRSVVAYLFLIAALFGVIAPGLPELFPGALMARVLDEADCADPSATAAGYEHPAFAFLSPTMPQSSDGAGAAEFLHHGGCRFAFVFWRQERSFAQRAEAIGGRYKSLPRIEGFNLGTGRAVSIGVYQSLEAPSQ